VLIAFALLAATGAHADMFELPGGKYTGGSGPTSIETLPHHRLRITTGDQVVEGAYQVTATKMGDYHATFTSGTGEPLQLTLHYGCSRGKNQLQFCVHGKDVKCSDLTDEKSKCTEGPAIDGSKINAPPSPAPPDAGLLPQGVWREAELRIESQPEHKLRFTFPGKIVITAGYVLAGLGGGSFRAALTVEKIVRKPSTQLPSTHQLGADWTPGAAISLALTFTCDHDTQKVNVCVGSECRLLDADPKCLTFAP
jgi:hypothetical protein